MFNYLSYSLRELTRLTSMTFWGHDASNKRCILIIWFILPNRTKNSSAQREDFFGIYLFVFFFGIGGIYCFLG